MAERVVVPLEPGDVDEADRAPSAALLEREKRFELFGEPAEVHQLRLRVAVRLVGEIGDQRFEIARDAADGGVLGGAARSSPVPSCRRNPPKRLNRLLLRFLPEPFVAGEHGVDGASSEVSSGDDRLQMFADPFLQFVPGLRLGVSGGVAFSGRIASPLSA